MNIKQRLRLAKINKTGIKFDGSKQQKFHYFNPKVSNKSAYISDLNNKQSKMNVLFKHNYNRFE